MTQESLVGSLGCEAEAMALNPPPMRMFLTSLSSHAAQAFKNDKHIIKVNDL